jgi:hypothetical protein
VTKADHRYRYSFAYFPKLETNESVESVELTETIEGE